MLSITECMKEARKICHHYEYTEEYSDEVKSSHISGEILTADEHTQMSEEEWGESFADAKSYIYWYFRYLSNVEKLDALGVVAKYIKENNIKTVLSLGAGSGVLEYLLHLMTDIEIIVTDYDRFFCDKAQSFFGGDGYEVKCFDLKHDHILGITSEKKIDMIVMFGSACSMDDHEYSSFLQECREARIAHIFTFEAGVSSNISYYRKSIITALSVCKQMIVGRYTPYQPVALHAYVRPEHVLKKIFKSSGYRWSKLHGVRMYEKNSYELHLVYA